MAKKKTKIRSTSSNDALEEFFRSVEKGRKSKDRKSAYARSRDSMCVDCEFSGGIGNMDRDGSTLLSCKCSVKGLTTVKLQACPDFRLRTERPQAEPTERKTDLLSWTGVWHCVREKVSSKITRTD